MKLKIRFQSIIYNLLKSLVFKEAIKNHKVVFNFLYFGKILNDGENKLQNKIIN